MSIKLTPDNDATSLSSVVHLPVLLARLAMHSGRALPSHRFSLTALEALGITPEDDPAVTAAELWRSAFPAGDAVILDAEPERESLPLLWIPEDDGEALLVRGKTSSGAYLCERFDGTSSLNHAEQLHDGCFVVVEVVHELVVDNDCLTFRGSDDEVYDKGVG